MTLLAAGLFQPGDEIPDDGEKGEMREGWVVGEDHRIQLG
jgi:hypothetical protein